SNSERFPGKLFGLFGMLSCRNEARCYCQPLAVLSFETLSENFRD
ncbi:hypothetical protein RRG08_004845, partial [Elysia crispata]